MGSQFKDPLLNNDSDEDESSGVTKAKPTLAPKPVVRKADAGPSLEESLPGSSDLQITVDMPEKHSTTMDTYITFRVITVTTRPEFDSERYEVRRRYNDFVWLRQQLQEAQPTLIIPPVPEKHGIKNIDRFGGDFITYRQIALQRFMNRLAEHPVLSLQPPYKTFVTAKQNEFAVAKKSGPGFLGRLVDSAYSRSASYMLKNREKDFDDTFDYLEVLSDKLGCIDRVAHRVSEEEAELAGVMAGWPPVLNLWASIEDSLSQPLKAVAKATDESCMALNLAAKSSEGEFSETIKEYVNYVEAVKSVLRRRDAAQAEHEAAVDDLAKKKDDKTQVSADVERLSDKLACVNADLRGDLERWHESKRRDLRHVFSTLADRHMDFYEKTLAAWEEAIPVLKEVTTPITPDHVTSQMDYPFERQMDSVASSLKASAIDGEGATSEPLSANGSASASAD